jgi:hypothetical protein
MIFNSNNRELRIMHSPTLASNFVATGALRGDGLIRLEAALAKVEPDPDKRPLRNSPPPYHSPRLSHNSTESSATPQPMT